MCSAIGSPARAITSGVNPTAPTGSASSQSRSKAPDVPHSPTTPEPGQPSVSRRPRGGLELVGEWRTSTPTSSLVTDARLALRRPGPWFDSRQGDLEEELVRVEQVLGVEDGLDLALEGEADRSEFLLQPPGLELADAVFAGDRAAE